MNHRSKMFDVIESPNQLESNTFHQQFISAVLNGAKTMLNDALWSISDFIWSPEEEILERTPIWHPSKLDRLVDFEAVQRALRNESKFIDN